MDTQSIRRANLKKLAVAHGGFQHLATKLGYANGSYLYQMAGPNPIREISERTARKIETTLDLPQGWLDREEVATAPAPAINLALIDEAVLLLGRALEAKGVQLPPTKMTQLTSLVYHHALAQGRVDPGYVEQMIALLQ